MINQIKGNFMILLIAPKYNPITWLDFK